MAQSTPSSGQPVTERMTHAEHAHRARAMAVNAGRHLDECPDDRWLIDAMMAHAHWHATMVVYEALQELKG